jgi:RNA polymerase sigma-70 factor (ECF subfamily)
MSEANPAKLVATDELAMLREGGQQALAELFSKYRGRLERMVEFRLDRRLLGRVDVADVLQDAYIEVARRIDDYLSSPAVSFFVWARQMTWQTLLMVHRRHLGQKRDPRQEVRFRNRPGTNATSFSMAQALIGEFTTPSQAAVREEQATALSDALEALDDIDCEVLALRHYEYLSNHEVAEVLGLSKTAASNRYVRALKRLKQFITSVPGFGDAASNQESSR